MIPFTREWIESYPKIINDNECWIPQAGDDSFGYIRVSVGNLRFYLHRIVLCVYYDVEYGNLDIESCHNSGCAKSCFNHKHIRPGSRSDNMQDRLRDGNHHNAKKDKCPKCGGDFTLRIYKTGMAKGRKHRFCKHCLRLSKRKSK